MWREVSGDADGNVGLCEVHCLTPIGCHEFAHVNLYKREGWVDALKFGHFAQLSDKINNFLCVVRDVGHHLSHLSRLHVLVLFVKNHVAKTFNGI